MIAERLRSYWRETHSPQFELIRHFCGQFFESEFVSQPGQLKLLFAGVLAVLASLSIPFLQAYYHKYLVLKRLDDTSPFRLAVLTDSLFLIALTMVFIGLLTALLWQSLFPDRRDYLALAALPLRMQEIFRAKFAALLGVVTLATMFLAVPLSVGLPSMMQPQRATAHFTVFGPMENHVLGIAVACVAAGLFVFFVLVALQGVLLNVLPLRTSARLSSAAQALLLIGFLAAIPAAVAIPRFTYSMDLRPDWAVWAPPLWFLGLEQKIVGTAEPLAERLAVFAIVGWLSSAVAAMAAYWWSYRRHRVRVLESAGSEHRRYSRTGWPTPRFSQRTLGVFAFIAKTLGRSPQHRLILSGFMGIAVAISANGLVGAAMAGTHLPILAVLAAAHLALSLFTLAGLHYLFRLPVTPRANWVFRLCEPGHTAKLLSGVERFMICGGVLPVALINLAVDSLILGFERAAILTLLTLPPALLLLELLLFPCFKIPFTSLYLPARRMITETILQYGVGVVLYVSVLSTLLSWCVDAPQRWVPAVGLMTIAYWRLRVIRLDTQRVGRIEFEELPDIVIQQLGLERD